MAARLEHVNYTVTDPHATAAMLDRVFGWKIRWQGDSIHNGTSLHVGPEETYLALYASGSDPAAKPRSYWTLSGLNHVGVVVDDLDATEARVKAEGLETHSHADYEPGRRFYFHDTDGIEYEAVQYD
ncbi:MAG: VOC family protein [Rhodobacteraceae bacterium]|nr:VOC family protein [Paracoccaceae bacterium]